jgi:hypothetical protein
MFLIVLILSLFTSCAKQDEAKPRADFESLMGNQLPAWQHVQTPEDFDNLAFFKKIYEQNKQLITAHSADLKIPKVLHFIWLGPKPFPRTSVENIRSWIAKNPDWKILFWTDRERPLPHPAMQRMLVKDFKFSKLENRFHSSDNFGEKSDVLRYEILHQQGGVYVDHDVKCLQPFDALNGAFDLYCGLEVPFATSLSTSVWPTNNILASAAGHPILTTCLDWLDQNWDQIERDYPGKDRDAVINRVSHRTFLVLGESFKLKGNAEGRHDMALPAFYFNAPKDEWAIFSRHQYAGSWFENESVFEKTTRERLMMLSKKTNKILLFCGVMASLNLLGFAALFVYLRRYKKA